jgi:hypothetical protein
MAQERAHRQLVLAAQERLTVSSCAALLGASYFIASAATL